MTEPARVSVTACPVLEISVAGLPVPQGSKIGRIVGRRVRLRGGGGAVAVVGAKVALVEQADMATKLQPAGRLSRWREGVATRALLAWRAAYGQDAPWQGPIELSCEFVLPRSERAFLRSGALRAGVNGHPIVKPDLGKLVRAVEDALSGVAYRDDAQIVRYGEILKRYASRGGIGGVVIRVGPLS